MIVATMVEDSVLSAVEQAPYFFVACEGPDLHVVVMNAVTRAMLRTTSALGRPAREVLAELDGQQIIDVYYQVYRTGEPVTGQEWRFLLPGPEGSVREFYATFTITPWRTVDGDICGVIGTGSDVTELVHARIAAQQQAARLEQRIERTRELVTALQEELLPRGLPVLPGLHVAASYVLAGDGVAVGGDWFDAVTRPDGTVALVVGDVVGHGVAASGAMGQLRAVLQERLADGTDLVAALGAVDRFARRLPAAHAATVCVALVDQRDGAITYCTAGHPPPLVISAGGETRYLTVTGGSPLATSGAFPFAADRLEPGDMLLLYSDGVLERHGRDVTTSTVELARVVADVAGGRTFGPRVPAAERVCSQALEMLLRAAEHDDDVTLLAAQRVEAPLPLVLSLRGERSSLAELRAALQDWLDGLTIDEPDTVALQHAVGELVANAIEHSSGPVAVRVTLSADGHIEATVTDGGRWLEPEPTSSRGHGRGLALATQLIDSLRVDPGEGGTTAHIRHQVYRRGQMLGTGAGAHPAHGPQSRLLLILDSPGNVIRVDGPVDAVTAEQLRRELLYRSRGGTRAAIVDLTGVTHLASAGVAVLHYVAGRHRQQGTSYDLYAAPGTVAQQILSLVGLAAPGNVIPGR